MAYKILKSTPRRNVHEFFIDTVDELEELPKEFASTALVATTGDTYIYTNNEEWVKFNMKYCPYASDGDDDDSGESGIVPTGTITITENDTYDVTNYANAEVNVPNPSVGTLNITQNGEYDVTEYANTEVNVPNPSTGTKIIQENGTYDVTSYASVGINVPTTATQTIQMEINRKDNNSTPTTIYMWNTIDDAFTTNNYTVLGADNNTYIVPPGAFIGIAYDTDNYGMVSVKTYSSGATSYDMKVSQLGFKANSTIKGTGFVVPNVNSEYSLIVDFYLGGR